MFIFSCSISVETHIRLRHIIKTLAFAVFTLVFFKPVHEKEIEEVEVFPKATNTIHRTRIDTDTTDGSWCGTVLSYYWPISRSTDPKKHHADLSAANLADVLTNGSHGSTDDFEKWAAQGVQTLGRVYPFRDHESVDGNVTLFLETVDRGYNLSIDELVGHKWSATKRSRFLEVLKRVKIARPSVRIVLWDATDWSQVGSSYRVSLMRYVDLIVFQRYVNERKATSKAYNKYLQVALDFIRDNNELYDKAMVGIGLHPGKLASLGASGVANVETILIDAAVFLAARKVPGIGIYAPLYISKSTLERINYYFSIIANQKCTSNP